MSLAVVGAALHGARVGLRAEEGVVVEVGPDVVAAPGDEVLDGTDRALLPGLVNGHTHAGMTLFRGFGSDLRLLDWLEAHIWPAEARLTADDVYWGTRLACAEMIRTGTVRFWDMYWHPDAVARAVEDAGLRATIGFPLVDGLDDARGREVRAEGAAIIDAMADIGPRVSLSLTPHSVYAVSEATLEWVGAQAEDRHLPIHTHFMEVESETQGCLERTGLRPAAYLDRFGLLGPRTVLAHGVWMEDADFDLVAERGSTVVTNPVSNLKLAVGRIFPYGTARARGIPVGLGTDGASSNNSLDLVADVKFLALLQKHEADDPAALPAAEAWEVASGVHAPVLGGGGPLAVGDPADFLLVRTDMSELGPGNLLANLVYSASGEVVDTTVVGGRVLMRSGVVQDEAEIRARVADAARRLGVLDP